MAEISIFKFEYEKKRLSDNELLNYKAFIAAYDINKAEKYLVKTVKAITKINTREFICPIHAITDDIRQTIVENSMPKKRGRGRPPKIEKQNDTIINEINFDNDLKDD